MAIGLDAHIHARREAPYHLQLEIVHRPVAVETSTRVTILCRVVRVFRSAGDLDVGDMASVELPVHAKGEGPFTGPYFLPYDSFVAATHLEAYLEGAAPEFRVACEEFCVIDACSDAPVLTLSELESVLEHLESRRHRPRGFWEWFF